MVGGKATIEGDPLDEYVALMVLEALAFGFKPSEALMLKNEEMVFKRISIKEFSRRKNLHEVKSRLIGKEGKTRRTIEEISDCLIVIGDNAVGIIGPALEIDKTIQAIVNLIRGTKQANTYRYLERMNATRKDEGLGLREDKKNEDPKNHKKQRN